MRELQVKSTRRALAGPSLLALSLAASTALAASSAPQSCQYESAEVYVAHFDRLHVVSWGVEDVKRGYILRASVRDPDLIAGLLSVLRAKASSVACSETPCAAGDLRFVAEFKGDGTCSELFVANSDMMANVTAGTRGKIDKAFKERFTEWLSPRLPTRGMRPKDAAPIKSKQPEPMPAANKR